MAFLMETFKLFSGLIKFNLSGLSFRYFLLELLALVSHFDGEFFDLKSQLFNLSLVSATILFKSQVVFFFLAGSERPLFKFLLVPVHFKFKLVHTLISFEYHVLDVIETILLICNPLLKLLDLILKSARLALSNLLHMLLRFNLFIFGIYETLGVDELHLD